MKTFFWKGFNLEGKKESGTEIATTKEELQNKLLNRNIALFYSRSIEKKFGQSIPFSKKISLKEKALFFEQLHILIESGIEITKALEVITNQIKNKKFKNIVNSLIAQISSGTSLSKGMAVYSNVFSPTMVSVVKSGEITGKLDLSLKYLSKNLNQNIKTRQKLKQSTLLPMITLTISLIIMYGIFVFIIPQFETFFTSLEKELPESTKFVLNISRFLQSNKVIYIISFIILLIFSLKLIFKNSFLKKTKDKLCIKFYFIGKMFLLYDLTTFLQTIYMLLKSGVDLKKSLEFSQKSVNNSFLKEAISEATIKVINGNSLKNSLETSSFKIFPKNLITMVEVGEKAGNLDTMLEKSAKILNQELMGKLEFYTSIIQPILVILVGIIITILMLSVYIPIFNTAQII